jgi:LmbE family N-acetylglucosaminyl deacetylase
VAAALPDAALRGRTVLAIFAHPDDESLACGGTIARLTAAGARVVLVCASRGEHGAGPDHAVDEGTALGLLRTRELHEAARVLGIADVLVFDHPDGELRWADVPELHGELVSVIRAERPDAVLTFDNDGLYWHADHIGVHERTDAAVRSLGAQAPPLYYVTFDPAMMSEVAGVAAARGWTPPADGLWSLDPGAFGLAAPPPSFSVDVGPWVPRKLEAIACYRSQFRRDNPFTRLTPDEARRWLGRERFRHAPHNVHAAEFEQMGRTSVT